MPFNLQIGNIEIFQYCHFFLKSIFQMKRKISKEFGIKFKPIGSSNYLFDT